MVRLLIVEDSGQLRKLVAYHHGYIYARYMLSHLVCGLIESLDPHLVRNLQGLADNRYPQNNLQPLLESLTVWRVLT